jgi:hypothetical protein
MSTMPNSRTQDIRPERSAPANWRGDGAGRFADSLARRFASVRQASMRLRQPLNAEDCQAQSMPDASPAKWHLAHTTWFFEQFVLQPFLPVYQPHHPQFAFLFNSYYNAVGPRHQRPHRGLLTRPALAEVERYRLSVDAAVLELIDTADGPLLRELQPLIELGMHHEQQHQELLLTDIKHLLWSSPLRPA